MTPSWMDNPPGETVLARDSTLILMGSPDDLERVGRNLERTPVSAEPA